MSCDGLTGKKSSFKWVDTPHRSENREDMKDFSVKVSSQAGFAVFLFSGDVVAEAEDSLWKEYDALAGPEKQKIIFDFENVEYINSAGIAVIISILNKVNEEKGNLRFSSLKDHLSKILETVGLLDFVQSYPTLKAALSD